MVNIQSKNIAIEPSVTKKAHSDIFTVVPSNFTAQSLQYFLTLEHLNSTNELLFVYPSVYFSVRHYQTLGQ